MSCPAGVPEHSKMNHSVCRRPRARVERQRRAVLADRRELAGVDVDRDDGGAERMRDLHAVAADATGADDHREAPGTDTGATDGLVRRRQRIGDDRDFGERQAGCRKALLVDFAQAAARHHDVGREAAVNVVAGHLLLAADRGKTAAAEIAFATRQHRRHDDGLAEPLRRVRSGGDDAAADLVAERQRRREIGAHAVVEVAEVGVADAAAGDLDDHVGGPRLGAERRAGERRAGRSHQPAVGFDHRQRSVRVLWYRNTDLRDAGATASRPP